SSKAATVKEALSGALPKMRRGLQTFFERVGREADAPVTAKRLTPRPTGLRRRDAAVAALVMADGNRRAARTVRKKSAVATKRTATKKSTIGARGPKKKGIYQARRKSWPAR